MANMRSARISDITEPSHCLLFKNGKGIIQVLDFLVTGGTYDNQT